MLLICISQTFASKRLEKRSTPPKSIGKNGPAPKSLGGGVIGISIGFEKVIKGGVIGILTGVGRDSYTPP